MTEPLSIWLRPVPSGKGRPATHSRDQITKAAIALADADGLEAVSMRKVGEKIGAGAASLYRHVENREELLDLMLDSTAAEYQLRAVNDHWLDNVMELADQANAIMRRHPWLRQLLLIRPGIGPNTVEVMEFFLDLLADHPASSETKLEAFAMLNALTALHALSPTTAQLESQLVYLAHVVSAGQHPALARAFSEPQQSIPEAQRGARILRSMLTGLLGS